ncbi:hypothetical protein PaG_05833 [Moesziomyces aphidis]|uniref:TFIIS-type domain-containing protein n=1 Tax=Moesziomyces aphidis TaxID=84754 RepID=W3VHM6_MOEAP|nr:hypothetical protein PaG_05833 [Moesziomyces aphidis]
MSHILTVAVDAGDRARALVLLASLGGLPTKPERLGAKQADEHRNPSQPRAKKARGGRELELGLGTQLPPGRNALGKQRGNEMLFCPTCANCLIIQLDDQGNNKWSCHTCPYEFPIVRQMTTRLHLKRKEVDDVMGGEESWKNVDSADAPCPKCENPKAFFMQLQIRSADEPTRILSARDASGGGTWLGVTRSGAFATLTNFTEATPELPPGMERFESRGQLVRDWLLSSHPSPQTRQEVEKDIQQYLNNVGDKLQSYPGFNLLVGKVSKQGTVVGYITNRDSQGELAKPQPKIFDPPKIERVRMCRGMSNSILSEPWPKVHTGSQAFDAALGRASPASDQEQLVADLFSVLAFSSNPTQRSELRNSILIPPVQLPTPAGDGDWYATRTSTVILIAKDGRATFVERDIHTLNHNIPTQIPPGKAQRSFSWNLLD